jgi:hypothetical protein
VHESAKSPEQNALSPSRRHLALFIVGDHVCKPLAGRVGSPKLGEVGINRSLLGASAAW